MLWLSEIGAKTPTLIVAESAIGALLHYQLKQLTNTLYASTSGQLTENKVAEIRRLAVAALHPGQHRRSG